MHQFVPDLRFWYQRNSRRGSLLWGGLAQDCLLPSKPEADFLDSLERARAEADERSIVGVADHVPADATWERIRR